MNRFNRSEKPYWAHPSSANHLDQVRARIPDLKGSLQADKVCVYWSMAFVLWGGKEPQYPPPLKA